MSAAHNPDFFKLWAGQTISEIGSRVSRDGLPMTAVLLLGATPAQMGMLSAAGTASVLVFGLSAGLIADRFRRRPLMIATDLARALLLSTVPLAAWSGVLGMTQLIAVTAIAGLLTVLFDVAYQAYLPTLVETEELLQGNRRLGMSAALAEMVGPGMTGALIQTITAPMAILVECRFVPHVGSALLAFIRRPEARPTPALHAAPDTVEWLEGARIIRAHPALRALLFRTVTAWLFGGILMPLYILLAMRVLHFNAVEFGFIVALGGVGAMAGAWVTRRVADRWPPWRMFFVSSLVIGLATMLIPLASVFPNGPAVALRTATHRRRRVVVPQCIRDNVPPNRRPE